MLPLPAGRAANTRSSHDLQSALHWLRPPNIVSQHHAELRALVAWLAVFVAVAVLIGLGHVWLRLKVVDVGYRLSTTRQLIDALNQEQHELTVQVATLDSPARIAEVARTRLGMIRPDKGMETVLP